MAGEPSRSWATAWHAGVVSLWSRVAILFPIAICVGGSIGAATGFFASLYGLYAEAHGVPDLSWWRNRVAFAALVALVAGGVGSFVAVISFASAVIGVLLTGIRWKGRRARVIAASCGAVLGAALGFALFSIRTGSLIAPQGMTGLWLAASVVLAGGFAAAGVALTEGRILSGRSARRPGPSPRGR